MKKVKLLVVSTTLILLAPLTGFQTLEPEIVRSKHGHYIC